MHVAQNTLPRTNVLARKLALLAKMKGFTQEQIARKCGVSRITINRFFKGKTELRAGDLCTLLEVLGVSIQSEVNSALEGLMNGREKEIDPITEDISKIMQELSLPARKTLLQQVRWFANSLRKQTIPQPQHPIAKSI